MIVRILKFLGAGLSLALTIFGFWLFKRSHDDTLMGPANVLRVGLCPDFPPFEYKKQGQLVGFDVELAKALGEVLGVRVSFDCTEFPSLIPALNSGRIDVIISAMSPRPERKGQVNFSPPYHRASLALLHGKSDDPQKIFGPGKRIGVQLGSNMEAYLQHRLDKGDHFEIKSLADNMILVQELLVNRIDALLLDEAPAEAFAKSYRDRLASTTLPNDPWQDERMDYVMVYSKTSTWELRLNGALERLRKNSKLETLVKAFFPKSE